MSNITGVLEIKMYMGSYSDTLWIHWWYFFECECSNARIEWKMTHGC